MFANEAADPEVFLRAFPDECFADLVKFNEIEFHSIHGEHVCVCVRETVLTLHFNLARTCDV